MKNNIAILCFTCLMSIAAPGQEIMGSVSTELRLKIESLNEPLSTRLQGEEVCCRAAVPQFYRSRFFQVAWDDFLAGELISAIEDSENEGLNPSDYHFDKLRMLHEKDDLSLFEKADFELLLTDAFLLLATHLMSGKVDPQLIDPQWKVIRREGDPLAVLDEALIARNIRSTLGRIKPTFKAYRRLKEHLLSYKKIQQDGGFPPVPVGGTLKPGMESERVESLRKRLKLTGDLQSYTVDQPEIYDEVVQEGVMKFQKRHGLEADGNLGKETLAALNISIEKRLEQIKLNMERCRWLPQDLGERYIMVNLPAFELELINQNEVELEMVVAVGKPYRQTPVFSAKMSYLVFNPYWVVPPTILAQDILPAQRKNSNYLTNLDIKIIAQDGSEVAPSSIDWSTANPKVFPYSLRQEPGPKNALGKVKFIFPNPYNIYMHDTNHPELFAKPERALSSGCIRLSRPMELANYLLKGEGGWTEDRIKEIVKSKQNYSVVVKKPLEIHLQYWTSFIDEMGVLNFRKDIYNRDEKLAIALKAPPPGPGSY